MTRHGYTLIALVVLFLTFLCRAVPAQQIQVTSNEGSQPSGPIVQVRPQNSGVASLDRVVGSLASLPLRISTSIEGGYDNNSGTTQQGQGSAFTSAQVTLAYGRQWGATQLGLVAGGGGVINFASRTDENAFLDFSLNHDVSERLILHLDVYTSYQVEPDFSSDVGPSSQVGNFLQSQAVFSGTYQLARRWFSVSSYTFRLVRYDDASTAAFEDRAENTFSEEIHFRWTRTTTVFGSYRFELIDYVTAPRDSMTHFLLVGVDQNLTRKLNVHLVGGATARSYSAAGNSVDPHFEASLDYALGRHSSLSWTGSYSIEESAESTAVASNTFRTGLRFSHAFTARISSDLTFDYNHDENQTVDASGNLMDASSPTDAFIVSLGVSYRVRRDLSLNLRFEHSESASGQVNNSYARNRYSCGVSFAF